MTDWMLRATCRTRPADWWTTGDGGNRLAIALCRLACPVLHHCAADARNETGVIRAGTAWTDTGRPAPLCPCGRPAPLCPCGRPALGQAAQPGQCRTCQPPAVPIRARPPGRPRKRDSERSGTRHGGPA